MGHDAPAIIFLGGFQPLVFLKLGTAQDLEPSPRLTARKDGSWTPGYDRAMEVFWGQSGEGRNRAEARL